MSDGEPLGSTRAEVPGQVWCKCKDRTHNNHEAPEHCGEFSFKDGFCRECYRLNGGTVSNEP